MRESEIQLPVTWNEIAMRPHPGESAKRRTKPVRAIHSWIEPQRNRNAGRGSKVQPSAQLALKAKILVAGIEGKAVNRKLDRVHFPSDRRKGPVQTGTDTY